jgi:hypothetical protein
MTSFISSGHLTSPLLKYKEDLTVAEKLLEEGSSKLSKALRTKDFKSASVSQTWIETAQKKIKAATDRLNDIRNESTIF